MDVSQLILDVVAREVARQLSDVRQVRWASVSVADPLTVTFPGDTAAVSVGRLDSYTPTVGDTAVLVKAGTRWVAIGAKA